MRGADANILLLGENGTGKDVIAKLLYRNSARYGRPFVNIDLGTIPENLFESELFGFEKGAFTDARQSKAGRIEIANGGTLFLDEIGNLSMPMQAKLLTAIEKRCVSRLGSTSSSSIDVRIISATNATCIGGWKKDFSDRICCIASIQLRFAFRHLGNAATTSYFWRNISSHATRESTKKRCEALPARRKTSC